MPDTRKRMTVVDDSYPAMLTESCVYAGVEASGDAPVYVFKVVQLVPPFVDTSSTTASPDVSVPAVT